MMTFFALTGGLYAVGTAIFIIGLRNAPEAYEDETGFHLVWRNDDPETANVACVWDLGGAQPVM